MISRVMFLKKAIMLVKLILLNWQKELALQRAG
jgi:hypothetical protein